MISDMLRVAVLGGTATADRSAGWSLMLSQPLVGACLAGALVNPGPEWELWALRVPLGVGALLQLLLTDASLPAAQRQHDTAAAGVVGSAVGLLAMARLHGTVPLSAGGLLWVLVGVAAGLFTAVGGGWVARFHRALSRADVERARGLVAAGEIGAFEWLYWGGLLRSFALGAAWSWAATLLALAMTLAVLPIVAPALTGRRIGFVFAAALGAGLAVAYHAHVNGRRRGVAWAVLGAAAALVLVTVLGGGAR